MSKYFVGSSQTRIEKTTSSSRSLYKKHVNQRNGELKIWASWKLKFFFQGNNWLLLRSHSYKLPNFQLLNRRPGKRQSGKRKAISYLRLHNFTVSMLHEYRTLRLTSCQNSMGSSSPSFTAAVQTTGMFGPDWTCQLQKTHLCSCSKVSLSHSIWTWNAHIQVKH